MTLEELYHQSLEALPPILRNLGREKRLSPDEEEDLRSDVQVKLLEDDYRVLARWDRRASLKAYLVTVVYNLWHDRVRGEKGKIRVSTAARRLGHPAAPELEVLLGRQGLTLDEAYQVIGPRYPGLSRDEAEWIAARIKPSPGRRFESEDIIAQLPDLNLVGDERLERREKLGEKRKALDLLGRKLSELPEEDRNLLVRAHAEGVKFSRIARSLGIDQRPLYRRNERLLEELRTYLEAAGIRWEDLREVLWFDEPEFCLRLDEQVEEKESFGPHIQSPYRLSAFLVGTRAIGPRDWMVWHLNYCTDCFERYIGAARLLDAIEEDEASALSAAEGHRAVEPSRLPGLEILKKRLLPWAAAILAFLGVAHRSLSDRR
jgi:RNA polymerase sigma factor (sigma-70 family)